MNGYITDSLLSLEMESDNDVLADHPKMRELYTALKNFKGSINIAGMEFKKKPSGVYDLKITHSDGRIWKQGLTFPTPVDPDPYVTFDVTPGWRLSEYEYIKAVRLSLVALVGLYGLTKCEVTFS